MPSLLPRSSKEQRNEEGRDGSRSQLYLNVYDLTPINNYLYWFGLGIFHSGIEAEEIIYPPFSPWYYPSLFSCKGTDDLVRENTLLLRLW